MQIATAIALALLAGRFAMRPGTNTFGTSEDNDAVGEGAGLFLVLRDATAGDTTYRPGRFLYVEKAPRPRKPFTLDLNRLYNPPCAFSEFSTHPLPPEQNVLKARIEAGEKYPPRRAG